MIRRLFAALAVTPEPSALLILAVLIVAALLRHL